MAVGLPGCGKSTFYNDKLKQLDFTRVSSDGYFEELVETTGKSYNDFYFDDEHRKQSGKYLNSLVQEAIRAKVDIFWDQTNVVANARRKKLLTIGKNYKKIAVVFDMEYSEVIRINNERRLKDRHVLVQHLEDMKTRYEYPTLEEGFDEIISAKDL